MLLLFGNFTSVFDVFSISANAAVHGSTLVSIRLSVTLIA